MHRMVGTERSCGASVPEDTEADLAVLVEVGIQSHGAIAGGHQAYSRRCVGIVGRALDQEVEEACASQRSVSRGRARERESYSLRERYLASVNSIVVMNRPPS